jgi:iron complex outermembrane receptor protein
MKKPFAAVALIPFTAFAQGTASLPPVVVTATRVETPPFDVPASIDRIGGETIRDNRLQVNISESVGFVPGVVARDRQNYAQDVQLSIRGFGARSTFGVRGVRVIVDGIPATLPDGQGQVSHIDLGSADSIEVLRGPFSALYGNSSGGVVVVNTEEGRGPPTVALSGTGGSDDTWRAGAKVAGGSDGLGVVADVSRFRTDGYRDHSAAQRDLGNAKVTARPDTSSKLDVVLNSVALPKAQDPLGLTRAQWDANPRGVDPVAIDFDTRKTVEQTQLGATYERSFGAAHTLRVMAYGGHRGTEQFQAIPVASQVPPTHPGGVIVLARDYGGGDARWTWKGGTAQAPVTVVAGLAYDTLDEHRRGFQNFTGPVANPIRGVEGALRRDENNTATANDQYLQGSWDFAPRWRLDLGVRHSDVRVESTDNYIVTGNGNDSGSVKFSATLPVGGLMFKLSDREHLYVAAGSGFETPTLTELSYRPGGQPGLNFALQPARSDNIELGAKTRYDAIGELNLAFFETRTRNEIVTFSNLGGRAIFQNAGKTRRRGLELSWSRRLWADLQAQAAYTWLDATYRESFGTCLAAGCPTAANPLVPIPAGNRIPGIPRQQFVAQLGWKPPAGWNAGVEMRALSRVYVNDPNSEWAPGFGVAGANVGYVARWVGWDWRAWARVDNVFDKRYAGSVIVNEGNGRFYEPAPGRTWLVGLSGAVAF